MRRGIWLALTVALAAPAMAEAPASSVRPMPRPPDQSEATPAPEATASVEAPAASGLASSLRPMPRPAGLLAPVEEVAAATPTPEPSPEAMAEPVPEPAPETAPVPEKRKTKREKKEKLSMKGSVCGDASIKGEALAPIKGKVKGCGLDKPVRVTSISGIRLNQPATISCDTATAFKTWIDKGLLPALGRREVVEIRVAASYVCRPRNNKKGAKVSEHGRGGAVDVAGLVFSDGTQWSVLKNYGKELRRAHKAACGIFGTTLGPGSDGYHEDHLHYDTAQHRSGPYCR